MKNRVYRRNVKQISKSVLRSAILWLLALALFNLAGNTAMGQTGVNGGQQVQTSSPTVTVAASGEAVRFVAPGTVVQLRLEVYADSGLKVFDTELRGGNVLDWHLTDGAGQRLGSGAYACVMTIKSLSGRISQRLGVIAVQEKKAAMMASEAGQLTLAQQQAIGPLEADRAFTLLPNEEAITAVTHDGTDGQVNRTRGALSFRMGDFFSGKDKEQMRLTESGNLGIGTSLPEFKLDVAGAIRSREGFVFNNGSTLNVNDKGALTLTDSSGNITPNAAGTGTQNKLAKWAETGGAGTLTDSTITETSGGNVGINNPNPTTRFSILATAGAELRFDGASQGITPVLNVISQPSSTTQGGAAGFAAGTGGTSMNFADNLPFFIVKDTKANVINNQLGNGTILFTMLPSGNAGIGTTTPQAKLSVLTASGEYGLTHTNGTVTVGTFVDGIAGWLGTRSNHPLKFFTNNSASLMTLTTNGLLGIGTPSPTTRLEVVSPAATQMRFGVSGGDDGGYLISTNPSQAIIGGGARWNGTDWIARDQYASLIAQLNGVIQFTSNTGLTSGTTFIPTERMRIDASGNVIQNRDKGGLVKAMINVNADGSIAGCYNGITGSAGGNCGFTVSHASEGFYRIDFGFRVDDRFVSLTTSGFLTLNDSFAIAGRILKSQPPYDEIDLETFFTKTGSSVNSDFYLIIF